ncbi:hypothetical protein KKD70_00210 [Patescibacteria group bacterium]|nr:hypothetical protein [Patescibacteria group bacterium]
MADTNQNSNKHVIDLAQAQTKEQADASNDILAMEDELLGGIGGGKSTTQSSKSSKNTNGAPIDEAGIAAAIEKFHIPAIVQEDYAKLIPLILETESMDDEEREYWFQILPIMTEEQITKFVGILVNEKKQLAQLDKEYEDQLKKINEKHLNEWQEFETKAKRTEIATAEASAETEESALEEDLLKKLEDL